MNISKWNIPGWVRYIAQDENGVWWGYEVEPLQHDHGWYENEVGRNIKLAQENHNSLWASTLTKIY